VVAESKSPELQPHISYFRKDDALPMGWRRKAVEALVEARHDRSVMMVQLMPQKGKEVTECDMSHVTFRVAALHHSNHPWSETPQAWLRLGCELHYAQALHPTAGVGTLALFGCRSVTMRQLSERRR
jgi:hypothetical protein